MQTMSEAPEVRSWRSGAARLVASYGGIAEIIRDLHAYAGILLASLGAWALTARPGAGMMIGGIALFYLAKGRH